MKKVWGSLTISLLIVCLLSLRLGSIASSWEVVKEAVFHFDIHDQHQQVILNLRLPRTIGAMMIGAGFATAGALMQGVTRNPLSDSGLLGINAGAGLGLAVGMALITSPQPWQMVICSFFGAFISSFIVLAASNRSVIGLDPVRLLLFGTALSSFLAAISQAISLFFQLNQDLIFWYIGGAANISWEQIKWTLPLMLLALIGAILLSPDVMLLSLGDEVALSLGKDPAKVRTLAMGMVLVLAGVSVSLVGTISFVGLMVPQIMRFFVGGDYRRIVPASALGGALLVLVCDIIARIINPPLETPVGVIISLIGVPFLLLQVRRQHQ